MDDHNTSPPWEALRSGRAAGQHVLECAEVVCLLPAQLGTNQAHPPEWCSQEQRDQGLCCRPGMFAKSTPEELCRLCKALTPLQSMLCCCRANP